MLWCVIWQLFDVFIAISNDKRTWVSINTDGLMKKLERSLSAPFGIQSYKKKKCHQNLSQATNQFQAKSQNTPRRAQLLHNRRSLLHARERPERGLAVTFAIIFMCQHEVYWLRDCFLVFTLFDIHNILLIYFFYSQKSSIFHSVWIIYKASILL